MKWLNSVLCLLLCFGVFGEASARKVSGTYENFKIVVVGDTYSSGYQLDPNDTYISLLRRRLNENMARYRIEIVDFTYEGLRATGAVRLIPNIIAEKPDMVVLAIGGDDATARTDPTRIERPLEQIISILTHNNIYTLIIGFVAPENMEDQAYAMRYDTIFQDLASRYKLSFVPDLMADVKDDPQLLLFESAYPNEDGMKVIANNLYGIFNTMINKGVRAR